MEKILEKKGIELLNAKANWNPLINVHHVAACSSI